MSDYDCLIVGGGPAGLTAAIYAARFRLSTVVIDAGRSRAASIPRTHNHAGFPEGVPGPELLDRMRRQALRFDAKLVAGRVDSLAGALEDFAAQLDGGQTIRARAVILATGVWNRRPDIEDTAHDEALQQGRLRYCPVCDGFEVTDQDVGVIGSGEHGAKEASFLRSYSDRVTLIAPRGEADFDASQRGRLASLGVAILAGTPTAFRVEADGLSFDLGSGRRRFDTVYPALGSDIHSDLAVQMGAAVTDEGCIKVDAHQRTSVPGLYAAGDVVLGLDQISHAMGEAGVAATTLRNDLAALRPLIR